MDSAPIHDLARDLIAATPEFDPREQRVALSLYRLLAEGQRISPERLAQRAGLAAQEVEELLERWPGVYREDGQVVGFWGLALDGMPHRLKVNGRELRAWCAWDTLFLPELIGAPARVESPCPATGETVALEVVPGDGVRELAPETAVLSFLHRDEPFDADMIKSFCHYVHFFRDDAAARKWTAQHQGTFTLSIDEGFELGRITNRGRFGAALAGAA